MIFLLDMKKFFFFTVFAISIFFTNCATLKDNTYNEKQKIQLKRINPKFEFSGFVLNSGKISNLDKQNYYKNAKYLLNSPTFYFFGNSLEQAGIALNSSNKKNGSIQYFLNDNIEYYTFIEIEQCDFYIDKYSINLQSFVYGPCDYYPECIFDSIPINPVTVFHGKFVIYIQDAKNNEIRKRIPVEINLSSNNQNSTDSYEIPFSQITSILFNEYQKIVN